MPTKLLFEDIAHLRTPGVSRVCDMVRATGISAHPRDGQSISDLVMSVSVLYGYNSVTLQSEVNDWADALDSLR